MINCDHLNKQLKTPAFRVEYDALDAKRETPNAETLAAFAEIENGGGHIFTGETSDLFSALLKN